MSKQFTEKEWEYITNNSLNLTDERITRSLFKKDCKVHMNEQDPHSLFVELNSDSLCNDAINIGYQTPNQKIVVHFNEIDKLIETLQAIKVYQE